MDRFIAIKCPVRYKTLVTRTQIKGIIVAIWLFSAIGTVVFPHSLPKEENEDFLEYYDTLHLCMSDTHDHKFEKNVKDISCIAHHPVFHNSFRPYFRHLQLCHQGVT